MKNNLLRCFTFVIFLFALYGLSGCGNEYSSAQFVNNNGRGIGGTGAPIDDRGIGGTGIVGTITKFGSIWVNGLEIELTKSTQYEFDEKSGTESMLRLGQQVAVLANQKKGIWYAEKVLNQYVLEGVLTRDEQGTLSVNGVPLEADPNIPGVWPSRLIGKKVNISGYFEKSTVYVTDAVPASDIGGNNWKITGPVEVNELGEWSIAGKIDIPQGSHILARLKQGQYVTVSGSGVSRSYTRENLPFTASSYLVEHRSSTGQTQYKWSSEPQESKKDDQQQQRTQTIEHTLDSSDMSEAVEYMSVNQNEESSVQQNQEDITSSSKTNNSSSDVQRTNDNDHNSSNGGQGNSHSPSHGRSTGDSNHSSSKGPNGGHDGMGPNHY